MSVFGMAHATARRLVVDFLDFVWPLRCPVCGSELMGGGPAVIRASGRSGRPLLHRRCLRSLQRTAASRSAGEVLDPAGRVPIWAYLADSPQWFALLHRAKYGDEPELLDALVPAWARWLRGRVPAGCSVCLVPIPDDAQRSRRRGGSITGRLAAGLAAHNGWRVGTTLLRRRRSCRPQARQPDDVARAANVRGLFGTGDLGAVAPWVLLLLVDDQVTSGATVTEAVALLRGRGHRLAVTALARAARSPHHVGALTPSRGGP